MSDWFTDFVNHPEAIWGGRLLLGFGFGGGLWGFVQKLDDIFSPDFKILVWMAIAQPGFAGKVQGLPRAVKDRFECTFGKYHGSLRCVIPTFCISISVFVISTFILMLPFSTGDSFATVKTTVHSPSWFLRPMITAIGAAIFDYISLYWTRLLLGVAVRSSRAVVWVRCILLDIGTTTATAIAGFLLWLALVEILRENRVLGWSSEFLGPYLDQLSLEWTNLWAMAASPITGTPDACFRCVAPFYVSAALTSAWLWAFLLAGLILKAAYSVDAVGRFLNWLLDIEHKPFSAIGFVLGVIAACIFWIWAAKVQMFTHG